MWSANTVSEGNRFIQTALFLFMVSWVIGGRREGTHPNARKRGQKMH